MQVQLLEYLGTFGSTSVLKAIEPFLKKFKVQPPENRYQTAQTFRERRGEHDLSLQDFYEVLSGKKVNKIDGFEKWNSLCVYV